jgi:hypothetical protein
LTDPLGGRRDVLLGKFDSAASKAEYARVLSEWQLNGRRFVDTNPSADGLTVNELLARFLLHLEDEGEPKTTVAEFKFAFRPLKSLYARPCLAGRKARLDAVPDPTGGQLRPVPEIRRR